MSCKIIGLVAALVALAVDVQAQEPKTYFDYVEDSYVTGELKPAKALNYRGGNLLAFTTHIVDRVYARIGKPQTLMVIYEKKSSEDKPPFEPDTPFFAPVRLLPEYSYWRDNLPKVPIHQVLGGARYVFRGDQIEEVKRLTRPYAATLARKRGERPPDQASAVVEVLFTKISVLSEDAVRKLSNTPALLKAMRPEARERLAEFLEGDYREELRVQIIDAIGAAGATDMSPMLDKLAKRDDAVGAAALRALDALGKRLDTRALLDLTAAKSEAVRAFAYHELGARAAQDSEAFSAAVRTLSSQDPPSVRAAAARGLGESGAQQAIEPLSAALERGDDTSQASASALAAIGGEEAAQALKEAITDGPGNAESAAVIAMVELRGGCSDCLTFLRRQYESHPDEGIRQLIGIMLEINRPHKH